jgi:hypothetical protein
MEPITMNSILQLGVGTVLVVFFGVRIMKILEYRIKQTDKDSCTPSRVVEDLRVVLAEQSAVLKTILDKHCDHARENRDDHRHVEEAVREGTAKILEKLP